MKEKLSSPPVIACADFSKPFLLYTDSSSKGLGAVLYQVQDGQEKMISYASRGDSCPYAENLVITDQSQIIDSEEWPPLESTELNSDDWATEQSKDITLSRVIYLLKNGYNLSEK